MTELEDQLRDELSERAERASAAATDRPVALLAGLERRIRRTQLRRRIAATTGAALAVAVVIAIPVALLPGVARFGGPASAGHGSGRLSDPSLTPHGWTAVPYHDAQVSVPSSWVVQAAQGSVCGVTTHGAVWLGHTLPVSHIRAVIPAKSHLLKLGPCQLPATTIFMTSAPARLPRWTGQRLNGIRVIRLPGRSGSIAYAAPGLGAEVQAIGPKARQVIRTLTRAPISVVLARGPAFTVPAGWHWHVFGGVRFAAPGTWRVERVRTWGNCFERGVFAHTLQLSTARTSGCKGGLEMGTALAAEWAQPSGLTVGIGRLAASGSPRKWPAPGGRCWHLGGLRACMAAYPFGVSYGNPLALEVLLPGRQFPVTFEIGLAGTGAIPRTILDSISKP